MTRMDLRQLGPDFAISMFVVQGLADDFTPAELSRAYVDYITAPEKAFIALEDAGHMALMQKDDEFLQIIRDRIRPLAMRSSRPAP
jgi:pimeloyl-ACP methyl ester carboxylesterase